MGDERSKNENSDHAIAGGTSGFVTRLICQPLDVVKIRFQLQVEPIKHGDIGKYRSLGHAVKLIVREEGLSALWKGHAPAQILSVVYGLGQFYTYNVLKKCCNEISDGEAARWKKSINFMAGAAAGGVATIISYPFDTVRTRLVSQSSNNPVYRGILGPYLYAKCYRKTTMSLDYEHLTIVVAFRTILRSESALSFFRGSTPALLQIIPHSGFQFMFYGMLVDAWKSYYPKEETNVIDSMIAGSGAGILAKTLVYPLDLARKRLQIQGFAHARKGFGQFFSCDGLLDCLLRTRRTEGFAGLFKGLLAAQLKAAATTALHFTIYEQTLSLIAKFRQISTDDRDE